jgi:putative endonuclease
VPLPEVDSFMEKGGYIYIMTNKNKTTLYIGVTSDLVSRVLKHRQHFYPNSFTAKYNLTLCIYYERFLTIEDAIARETRLKKWRREKKVQLIALMNPGWDDLWNKIHRR